MSSNVIITNNGKICRNCNNAVGEKDNYCKVCGVPLSTEATILKSEMDMNIKLKTVEELVELTKDPKIIDYLRNLKQ